MMLPYKFPNMNTNYLSAFNFTVIKQDMDEVCMCQHSQTFGFHNNFDEPLLFAWRSLSQEPWGEKVPLMNALEHDWCFPPLAWACI